MLKNYIKVAIAVLGRRKFFTFISLFGISFTLAVLTVLTSVLDHVISSATPEGNRERMLYITFLKQENTKASGMMSGPMSYYFLDHYVGSLKTPEKVAIATFFSATNTYVNNKKLVIDVKYTNQAYWDVMTYDFIEGKSYNQQQIANGEKVAVISESIRKQYFGDIPAVVGKYITTDNIEYRVIGVVKDVPITMPYSYAHMYLPYTVNKADYRDKGYRGNYIAFLLARAEGDIPKIQDEFNGMASKIPTDNKDFDKMYISADRYLESFTRVIFGDNSNTGKTGFIIALSIFAVLIMLLPTINLVNINISRIMERSSEIGVRKAFGASAGTLVIQFIVENILLTFIGGLIGLVLSATVIYFINSSNLVPHAALSINITVLLYSILACLVFGLFSGVYPAWRMSKLQVVNALKAQ
jgi:putative ABC transport system permease protein